SGMQSTNSFLLLFIDPLHCPIVQRLGLEILKKGPDEMKNHGHNGRGVTSQQRRCLKKLAASRSYYSHRLHAVRFSFFGWQTTDE
ncbi:hypothetical protein, partial [Bifidobacterium aquikefiri]|uniref:hypothetical protein n=1 Tax=Bifidobacterium aquikefiri TaxID=1653207 RepID=UPI0039EA278D